MKICFLIPSMTGGGAERVTANLANKMDEMGHEVTILMVASDEVAYHLSEGIKVNTFGSRSHGALIGRVKKIFEFRRYFKAHKDTVFIAMATETNMFAALASIGIPVKLLVSERSNPERFEQKKMRDFTYMFVKKIVFQTEDASSCFSKRLQDVGRIIANPVAEGTLEPFYGERSKRFVAVGRLQEVKNHKLLLEAFAEIAAEYEDYDLYLYGEGKTEEQLREQCRQLEVAERVHFEGFCSDVNEKIRDASAYILTSDYEGISNSLLEAMAMGIPVVSTDCPIGGSRMLIEHKKNGLLIPVGDKSALTEAMRYIIEHAEDAKRMGEEAEKVKERFSIQAIADAWLEYMKE